MRTVSFAASVALALATISWTPAFAANQHVTDAVTHARTAVLQGQQGYPDEFIKHAQEAVKHAEMAGQEIVSPHLGEGIKQLKLAVTDAKNGYVEDAVETVQSAIEHLLEVP